MSTLFQRIDTVFVPSRDIEKSRKWYMQVLDGIPDWASDKGEYQCIKFGDTSITLFLTDDPVYFQARRSLFNFYVNNAEQAYSHLKMNGVKVEEIKEYGARYFAFYDIDGNCLEVCEY